MGSGKDRHSEDRWLTHICTDTQRLHAHVREGRPYPLKSRMHVWTSLCSPEAQSRARAVFTRLLCDNRSMGVIMNGHFGYCVRIMYMQIYIWENEHINRVCILIFTTFEQPYSYAVISWWISCCTIWKVVEINSTMKYRWNVKLFRGNLNCSVEIQAALSFPMGKTQQLIPY